MRAVVILKQEGEDLCRLTRLKHGEPHALGFQLGQLLSKPILRNVSAASTTAQAADGFGCLAAQVVHHLKCGVGDVYLSRPRRIGDVDFVYEIDWEPNIGVFAKIRQWPSRQLIFKGKPSDLIKLREREAA